MIRFLLALIALVSGLGAEAAGAHVRDEVGPGIGPSIGLTLMPRAGARLVVPAAPTRFFAVPGLRRVRPVRIAAVAGQALPAAVLAPAVHTGIDRART